MRIAFFHGLESSHKSDKNDYLSKHFDFVYDPPMNYIDGDSSLFDKVLSDVKKNKIDLIIGSSMGGWFAYCVSTMTGIPTLLFNPAMHSRSIEPKTKIGNNRSNHIVVLGSSDDIVKPKKTQTYISKEGVGSFDINWEGIGHRTPINVFDKWTKIASDRIGSVNESNKYNMKLRYLSDL